MSVASPSSSSLFKLLKGKRELILNIISPLLMLLAWEIAAQMGWIDVRFFPAPSKIFNTLLKLIESGALWRHLSASMQRLFPCLYIPCLAVRDR